MKRDAHDVRPLEIARPPQAPRRRRMVHWPVQGRFMLYLVGAGVGGFAAGCLLTAYLLLFTLRANVLDAGVHGPAFLASTLLTGALVGLVTWRGALVFSHRVAGPFVRLLRAFEQVRAGERGVRIRLRAKDHGKELAAGFNAMMEALERPPERAPPLRPTGDSIDPSREDDPAAAPPGG